MRTFAWCVRRELWEHRWVYWVPLLLGGILIIIGAWQTGQSVAGFDAVANPMPAALARRLSYYMDTAARMMFVIAILVAFVYCAEALHAERHDRSIIFWKSLPVGDATTIAAKAAVPMAVAPAIALARVLVCQGIAGVLFAGSGGGFTSALGSPAAALTEAAVGALWIAPAYAWILFISALARRAVLLIAIAPLLLASMIERMGSSDTSLSQLLLQRGFGRYLPRGHLELVGGVDALAVAPAPVLLRSPALWVGAAVAAVLLAVVARARRSAETL